MTERPLRILQVNFNDKLGGAAQIALTLHQSLLRRGQDAWMAVAHKESQDPHIVEIPEISPKAPYSRLFTFLTTQARQRNWHIGPKALAGLFCRLAEPRRYWNRYRGREDFDFPGTWQILNLIPRPLDLIHLHNLHYNYFDLRYLQEVSWQLPTVLTLHDAWLLSGHCAHSLDCERWQSGCGHCPYLNSYPAIRHDSTSFNWKRKKKIYSNTKLYLVSPSSWIMEKTKKSMLRPAALQTKVIHNGIDLNVFHSDDKIKARAILNLDAEIDILLFVASGVKTNAYKDYDTVQKAIEIVSNRLSGRKILFLALGGDGPSQHIGNAEIRFIPFQNDSNLVANYYQASDIYLHAARADTFPNVILEASACGKPVIATAVGGIPEQIVDGQTGFLTAPGNPTEMAERIIHLLTNRDLLATLGRNAENYARIYFGVDLMIDNYLNYYQEVLHDWKP